MSIEITASLIALLGVAFSAGIAYFTSLRQSKIESEKLRQEILQDFSVKLFEHRLASYPALYSMLSEYVKRIRANDITKQGLEKLLNEINDWDNLHSFFFSAQTGKTSHDLRKLIADLAKFSDKELQEMYSTPEARRTLRYKFGELELALKSELGIYAFEGPGKLGEFKKYQKYSEIPTRER